MSNSAAQTKTRPFTLRLSDEQRALLEYKAGKRPLGDYIRAKALDEDGKVVSMPARNSAPIKDQAAAYQLLGELGRSRIAENLSALSEAVRLGTLILEPEESAVLIAAGADIAEMRRVLMQALGHRSAANDY